MRQPKSRRASLKRSSTLGQLGSVRKLRVRKSSVVPAAQAVLVSQVSKKDPPADPRDALPPVRKKTQRIELPGLIKPLHSSASDAGALGRHAVLESIQQPH